MTGCFFAPPRPLGGDASVVQPDATADAPIEGNLMFVSSTTVAMSSLDGLADADAFCNNLATGSPTGRFVAWFSTPSINAVSRLGTSTGWVRVDGRPFASSSAIGPVLYPPRLDELGHEVTDDAPVFTGTDSAGRDLPGSDCNGLDRGITTTAYGFYDAGNSDWTDYAQDRGCDSIGHLYCFETGKQMPIAIPVPTGPLVFVTSTVFPPGASIGALDHECAIEGAAISPTRTFIALVAGVNRAAKDRVTSTGPWYRPDGIVGFDVDWTQRSPIVVTTSMTYANDGYTGDVMTGADDVSTPGTAMTTCEDWTSTGPSDIMEVGNASRSNAEAFDGGTTPCTSSRRAYCIEN